MKELSDEYLKKVSKKLQKETKAHEKPVMTFFQRVRIMIAIVGIVVMVGILFVGIGKVYVTGMAILSNLAGAGNETANETMDLEINETIADEPASGSPGLIINARNEEAG